MFSFRIDGKPPVQKKRKVSIFRFSLCVGVRHLLEMVEFTEKQSWMVNDESVSSLLLLSATDSEVDHRIFYTEIRKLNHAFGQFVVVTLTVELMVIFRNQRLMNIILF